MAGGGRARRRQERGALLTKLVTKFLRARSEESFERGIVARAGKLAQSVSERPFLLGRWLLLVASRATTSLAEAPLIEREAMEIWWDGHGAPRRGTK